MKYFFIIFLIFAQSLLPAPQNDFDKANELYKKGSFNNALQIYENCLKGGMESAAIRYNMGNCYFRSGKIGLAVLNYEKARLLAPNDEDINHNLQIARLHATDKIEAVPKIFIFKWYESLTAVCSSSGWMKWLIALSFIFASACAVFLFSVNVAVRRYLAFGIVFVFVLMMLNSALLYSRYQSEQERSFGVVTEYVSNVKYSPNSASNDAFVVHEGLKVKIEDRVDEWYKIRLEDGKLGWILKGHLEII